MFMRFYVDQRSRRIYILPVIRPPDIVVGGLILYQALFFLSLFIYFFLFFLFSSSNLRARRTELNHIRPHGRK